MYDVSLYLFSILTLNPKYVNKGGLGGAFREVYPAVEEEVRENGGVIFLHVCLLA